MQGKLSHFLSGLRNQKGSALLLVLLFLLMMMGLGTVLVSASLESSHNSRTRLDRSEALYEAQAGINEVIYRLNLPNDDSKTIAAGGSEYTVNGVTFNARILDSGGNAETCTGWDPDWKYRIVYGTTMDPNDTTPTMPTLLDSSQWTTTVYSVADVSSPYVLTVQHKLNESNEVLCYDEDSGKESTSLGLPVYTVFATGQVPSVRGGWKVPQRRTVRVELYPLPWDSGYAILTNGSVQYNGGGNGEIEGGVHANTDINCTGDAGDKITGSITAVGSASCGGTAQGGSTWVTVPSQDPTQYKSEADYFLDKDGKVWRKKTSTEPDGPTYPGTEWFFLYNASGTTAKWTPPGSTCAGWNAKSMEGPSVTSACGYQHREWTYSANCNFTAGTVYVDGSVNVTGNTEYSSSILAVGNINIGGSVKKLEPSLEDLTLLAGLDIEINGNSSANLAVSGTVGAVEQISIGGTPTLSGSVIAEHLHNCSKLVNEDDDGITIGGNVTVIYDGALDTPYPEEYKQVSWAEVLN